MIKPNRHTNPDYSVINISALIIKILKGEVAGRVVIDVNE